MLSQTFLKLWAKIKFLFIYKMIKMVLQTGEKYSLIILKTHITANIKHEDIVQSYAQLSARKSFWNSQLLQKIQFCTHTQNAVERLTKLVLAFNFSA